MEQKRVSFEIAKVIKEAGYNEPCDMYYHIYDDVYESEMSLEMTGNGCKDFINSLNRYRCAAPTYFDVWVWLWRVKKCYIQPDLCFRDNNESAFVTIDKVNNVAIVNSASQDPEESIIKAIEYLCENDLIK